MIDEKVITKATRQKFAKAEEMLKAKGFEVFNPVNEEWQNQLKESYEKDSKMHQPYCDGTMPDFYVYCLLRNLMALSLKDAIYLLDDWRLSPCATAEYYFFLTMRKQMIFQNRYDAEDYLWEEMLGKVRKGNPPGCWLEYDCTTAKEIYVKDNIDRVWMPIR